MKNNFITANKITLNEKKDLYVNTKKFSCVGGDPNSMHPKVFLKIPYDPKLRENIIHCPYCRQKFIYKNDGK